MRSHLTFALLALFTAAVAWAAPPNLQYAFRLETSQSRHVTGAVEGPGLSNDDAASSMDLLRLDKRLSQVTYGYWDDYVFAQPMQPPGAFIGPATRRNRDVTVKHTVLTEQVIGLAVELSTQEPGMPAPRIDHEGVVISVATQEVVPPAEVFAAGQLTAVLQKVEAALRAAYDGPNGYPLTALRADDLKPGTVLPTDSGVRFLFGRGGLGAPANLGEVAVEVSSAELAGLMNPTLFPAPAPAPAPAAPSGGLTGAVQ